MIERQSILSIFTADVRAWIERRAKFEGVSPELLIRERMREVAEHERNREEECA